MALYIRLSILALIIIFGTFTLFVPTYSEDPGVLIGDLFECAHALKGKVFAKNDREIVIQGFHYDGAGPAAWFHAMRKGIKGGVHTSEPSYYYTLPYPDGNCAPLIGDQFKAEGTEITLFLPVSIKELETIGMYCYKFCHNFGHVEIPKDLEVPAGPENLVEIKLCPDPNPKYGYGPCFSKGRGPGQESKQGGPNCSPVGDGPSPSPPSGPSPSSACGVRAYVPARESESKIMFPVTVMFVIVFFLQTVFSDGYLCLPAYCLI
ncbi:unnamed protein product [Orchesella dallaii]|uniref:DM13 domain-containing protein n=1 Tax=Orchesella dallaii TaxID=48710 RepID=A0ABP1PSJ0_9HEXA